MTTQENIPQTRLQREARMMRLEQLIAERELISDRPFPCLLYTSDAADE